MSPAHLLLVAPLAALCAPLTAQEGAPAAPTEITSGYRSSAALADSLRSVAAAHPDVASVETIGASRGNAPILALTLRSAGPGSRPAILLVGGLDGAHVVSGETVVRLAERIASSGGLLERATFHLIACANPDALDATIAGPAVAVGTRRPVDDDRDGTADEDGPRDLDGNGVITQMRVKAPRPPHAATHVVDEKEPALLRSPDPKAGELASYAVFTEGIDADGDGLIAEDGTGAVDLNRNFPHRWPEFAADAGPHQISEPESKALAQFVLAHPDIVAAIVYGRHDTLVTVPDSSEMDSTTRTPMVYLAADHPTYQELGKLYRETTGHARAASADPAGSFWLWLADHRGLLAVASSVWGRPDPAPPPASGEGTAATEAGAPTETAPEPATPETPPPPEGRGPFAQQGTPPAPPAAAPTPPPPAPDPGRRGRGGGRRGGGPGGNAPSGAMPSAAEREAQKATDEESAAWLTYLRDERGGLGFVEWRAVDHPTFGTVEVGGFHPLAKTTPPAGQLDGLADKQLAFVAAVVERLPSLAVEPVTVSKVADGMWRIETSVANVGRLPTTTRMGRTTRATAPVVVRLSVPVDRVVSGQRVHVLEALEPGERMPLAWIVRAPSDETVEVQVTWAPGGTTVAKVRDGAALPAE